VSARLRAAADFRDDGIGDGLRACLRRRDSAIAGRCKSSGARRVTTRPDAVAALNAALDGGVTFIDTADGYGSGRSQQIIGRVLRREPTPHRTTLTSFRGSRIARRAREWLGVSLNRGSATLTLASTPRYASPRCDEQFTFAGAFLFRREPDEAGDEH
jgi:hypothetical protein